MTDIFDNPIPKYLTAQRIYDALCELVQTEEANILAEIGVDVSYEGQHYYYTDEGNRLMEKFEEIAEWNGSKVFLFELAIHQINYQMDSHYEYYVRDRRHIGTIHDIVFSALRNSDLAKRIGFKRLFVDNMLGGNDAHYDEIIEQYGDMLSDECYRFDYNDMKISFMKLMDERGTPVYVDYYNGFSGALHNKVMGLKLEKEKQLIIECRTLLTSYDDFILGLRMNQALYEQQEQQYRLKVAELQAGYEQLVRRLLATAEAQGIDLQGLPNAQIPELGDKTIG